MKTLQVGKSYKDSRGSVYTVENYTGVNSKEYPFKCCYVNTDGLECFSVLTKEGKFFSDGRFSYRDLIIPVIFFLYTTPVYPDVLSFLFCEF